MRVKTYSFDSFLPLKNFLLELPQQQYIIQLFYPKDYDAIHTVQTFDSLALSHLTFFKHDAHQFVANITTSTYKLESDYDIDTYFNAGTVVVFTMSKINNAWRVETVSESIKELGYEKNHFLHNPNALKQSIHEKDCNDFFTLIDQQCLNMQQNAHMEFRIYDSQKNRRWISSYTHLDFNSVNKSLITGYFIDITSQKRSTDKLKRSESRFKLYLDQLNDSMFVFNAHGQIIDANKHMSNLLKYGTLTKKNINDIFEESFIKNLNSKLTTIKNSVPLLEETLFLTSDGKKIPVELKIGKFDAEERFVCYARDIRYKKNTQLILKEHNDIYRAIINATTEYFWMLDAELRIIDVNYALCSALGYRFEEMIGKSPFDFMEAKDQNICHTQAKQMQNVTNRNFEISLLSIDGKQINCITSATTLFDRNNSLKTFAFMTDISKHKAIEYSLKAQQKEIEQKNRNLKALIETEVQNNRNKDAMMYQQNRLASMGEMIGNIAHQWRQPLNILALVLQEVYISGQLGTLTNEKLDNEYTKANNVLQFMSQTIDDFRTFFKTNEGEKQLFNIAHAIKSIKTLILPSLEHNSITIEIESQNESLEVYGKENELKQVIINLLNNAQEAIKSTHHDQDGKITITTKLQKKEITIIVEDNGAGIPDDIIDKIFEPYFTTKHMTQGTGLGLYMSSQIIHNTFQGKLTARNSSKGGAIFTITVPEVQKKQ